MKTSYHWTNHVFNFLGVILGVYLGFYMNETGRVSQENRERRILMSALVADLASDIKTFEDYQIPVNIQHKQDLDSLLNALLSDSIAEVNRQLPVVFQLDNFAATTTTYSSMKASGKLALIEDLELQQNLTWYYEGIAQEGINKGQFQLDIFTDELLGWLAEHADLVKMEIRNKDDLVILQNKVLIYSSAIDQKLGHYEMQLENSKQLKAQIDSLLSIE